MHDFNPIAMHQKGRPFAAMALCAGETSDNPFPTWFFEFYRNNKDVSQCGRTAFERLLQIKKQLGAQVGGQIFSETITKKEAEQYVGN
jgi:hypothetical protein